MSERMRSDEALRWRLKRAPAAAEAAWRDGGGLRPPRELASHLLATVGWIEHAHDATGRKGVARSYSLVPHRRYARRGWLPAYPETTGYLIPTLIAAARHLGRDELTRRALEMAEWEAELQLDRVRGGTVEDGEPRGLQHGTGAFGWIAAQSESGDERPHARAARAAKWLVEAQDEDGAWRRGARSSWRRAATSTTRARGRWRSTARARATRRGRRGAPGRRVRASQQRENGWFAENCLDDPERPLLHTIAYAAQGVLEIGLLLDEPRFVESARKVARGVATQIAPDGALPGRLDAQWRPAARWSCVTGEAQMVLVWDRLDALTAGAAKTAGAAGGEFKEVSAAVLRHVLATQDLDHHDPGVKGGVAGSFPIWGDYGRYEYLNWAAKFLADAILGRLARQPGGTRGSGAGAMERTSSTRVKRPREQDIVSMSGPLGRINQLNSRASASARPSGSAPWNICTVVDGRWSRSRRCLFPRPFARSSHEVENGAKRTRGEAFGGERGLRGRRLLLS
jgi:hypothetical protein